MNTTRSRARALILAFCLPGGALAQGLSLPQGAVLTATEVTDPGSYALPIKPWSPEIGLTTSRIEGRIEQQAWRIDSAGLTALQLLAPLRDQLLEQGFTLKMDCAAKDCGGFDFRFGTVVLPSPAMYVDVTNYQFAALTGPDGGAVTLLASRARNSGYVQIIRAGFAADTSVTADAAPIVSNTSPPPEPTGSIPEQLEARGHVVLRDMIFATGASTLGDQAVASLDALAAYLKTNPTRQIVFVGHTDATGSLEVNQTISRRRAQAAVDYLRNRHDIPAGQISANGVGYLAPLASNLTQEGRDTNRRVEAVLISVE